MNIQVRRLVAAVSVAAILSLFISSVAEAKTAKYTPRNGTFYTLEYSDPAYPNARTETRWGRINSKGVVTPLSDDLGLRQVTDADYSPASDRVYVLSDAYSTSCKISTFDPDDPEGTLTLIATISRAGFTLANCNSMTVHPSGGDLYVSSGVNEDPEMFQVNVFDSATGAFVTEDIGFNPGYTDDFSAMDYSPDGGLLTVNHGGAYTLWDGDNVAKQLRGNTRGFLHSVQFDGAAVPWVLKWRNSVQIGKITLRSGKVTWGKALREAGTRLKWHTDTVVFIPQSR